MIKTIEELRVAATELARSHYLDFVSFEHELKSNDARLPSSVAGLQHLCDNLALDTIAFALDLKSPNLVSMIRELFTAAEIVFETHKNLAIAFDRAGELSWCGSPWLHYCATPTEYVVCWLRRALETGECEITGPIKVKHAAEAIKLFGALIEACEGVTEDNRGPSFDDLKRLIRLFCYDRLPLIVAVEQKFKLTPSTFTHEDVMREAELSAE